MKIRVVDLFRGLQFRTIHTARPGTVGEPTPEGVVVQLQNPPEVKTLHAAVLVWVDFQ